MSKDRNNKKGFTLAEVLITLTIIGVVAALTIPSLLADVSDKTYEAKRKGFETRMAQAISQIGTLNAYEAKIPEGYTGSETATQYAQNYSSMNFVTDALSKVYKISNVCEFENFQACDFPSTYYVWYTSTTYTTKTRPYLSSIGGDAYNPPEYYGGLITKAVAVRTKNGESMILWYNPRCIAEQDVPEGGSKIWKKEVCLAMMIDLDGAKKGPNTVGKDVVFGLVLYPDTPYLVTMNPSHVGFDIALPSYSSGSANNIQKYCESQSGHAMAKGSLVLPSREQEYIIHTLWTGGWGTQWTSTIEGSGPDDYGWMIDHAEAILAPRTRNNTNQYCVLKESR